MLRAAVDTQIRGLPEIQDLGSHCSQHLPSLKLDNATQDENRVPKGSKRVRDSPLLPLLESHRKTKLYNCSIYAEGLGQSHAGSLVVGPVSEPLGSFCGFSCGVLNPSGSYNPSSPSFSEFSKLGLMFGCGSLHLFPSVAR